MIKEKYVKEAVKLRKKLHSVPEHSMNEKETKKILKEYLEKNTSLEIHDKKSFLYAVKNPESNESAVAFRADMDAVTCEDGKCRHLCGHDGHSAILAAFGKMLSDSKTKRKTVIIFQPGEESGEGAEICSQILKDENISEIYAFHNIPGYKTGDIILRKGTFACASTGLEIKFTGTPAHAAYPENGKNPAEATAAVITKINDFVNKGNKGILMSTVAGIECGSRSFGLSAAESVLRLTVRAEYEDEFKAFTDFINITVSEQAAKYNLEYNITEHEKFSSTENSEEYINKVSEAAEKSEFASVSAETPFRWSEDFGVYLKETGGAIFGIGNGENGANLHTEDYEFSDEVIPYALEMFMNLSK